VRSTTKARSDPGAAGPDPTTGFERRLGLFDSTMLVAGTLIGSGIFIVSADIARGVGSSGWLLAIWIVTGIIILSSLRVSCEQQGKRFLELARRLWHDPEPQAIPPAAPPDG
jgi:amino acid permease